MRFCRCLGLTDDKRYWEAYSKGGKRCCDKEMVAKSRSVGKEMLKVGGVRLS